MSAVTLHMGVKDPRIRELHRELKKLGYYVSDTDLFDLRTLNALKAFQNDSDLRVTGIADDDTLAKLQLLPAAAPEPAPEVMPMSAPAPASMPVSAAEPEPEPAPVPVSADEPPVPAMSLEARGGYISVSAVNPLPERKREVYNDGFFSGLPENTSNNACECPFMAELNEFSDDIEKNSNCGCAEKPVTPEIPVTDDERPVLSEGSRGEWVITLQKDLTALGYYRGTVDGIFGSRTPEAVKNLQSDFGLVDDGIVGARTWRAIDMAFDVN